MKTQKMKYAPLALAVAALFTAPIAFADDNDNVRDFKLSAAVNLSGDISTTQNHTKVTIEKDMQYKQHVDVSGRVTVRGTINIDSSAAAVVDDKQINYLNSVDNDLVTNSATVGGNALQSARGNIGVNVTAGDNNQQANSAALAAADASFLFGSSDAEIFARQDVQSNWAHNLGTTNAASLGGNALQNATGNIGVNISAGNSNQQKNDLAASVAVARMATATVAVKQMNDHNSTVNSPINRQTVTNTAVRLDFAAGGSYGGSGNGGYSGSTGGTTSGSSWQANNFYPDTWSGATHPAGVSTGHIDMDGSTQGAVKNPLRGNDAAGTPIGGLSFDNRGSYSGRESGSLGFSEAGNIALRGSVTGNIPVVTVVAMATTNTSSLGSFALQNASGNIGVNIASGTNNQQYNGLAISATQAGSRPGGGGGSGGGEPR